MFHTMHQQHNSRGNNNYNAFTYSNTVWPPHFHKNFELILVNHATTDNCREIAHSYTDERIKHIDILENLGAPSGILFAEFFEEMQNKSGNEKLCFEILTYHEYGKEKYEKQGKEYKVRNGFVTPEDVKILATEIKNKNLKLIHT